MDKPLVSIFMMTYNHEKYIEQALDSIIMQKVDFPYEIVLGEDCSTDNTRKIVTQYAKKYSDKFKLLLHNTNIGAVSNQYEVLKKCTGKYIAMLEGDDYWIDPYKLQKQVDFLEANLDYGLCFHDAIILWDDKSIQPKYFCDRDQKETTGIEEVINSYYIPTASMIFRKNMLFPLPVWFLNIYNGDWAIQMLLAIKGKIKYLDECMSVYRKNQGALSGGIGGNIEFVNSQKTTLLKYINEQTNANYEQQINAKIRLLKKDIERYKLKKKSKLLFWFRYPKAFIRTIVNKLVCND